MKRMQLHVFLKATVGLHIVCVAALNTLLSIIFCEIS